MGYVERALRAARPRLDVGLTGAADTYDVDHVGLDDGLDDGPLRLVLQLGQGYMIYLYVVGVAQPGAAVVRGPGEAPSAWFHTFWTKDCAVAEVDMEEHGPPRRVGCDRFDLPPLHDTFVLQGPRARRQRITRTTFEARVDDLGRRLALRWHLAPRDERAPCDLVWSSATGWSLRDDGVWRPLEPGERVTFADPLRA